MYMKDEGKIWLATGDERVYLNPSMANRHGLIAGATGTGKTVTLKVIAESFSDLGVPVFVADIKGDLTGMCQPGAENKHIRRSIDTMHIENFDYCSYPVRFFDVYGKNGHPFLAKYCQEYNLNIKEERPIFNIVDVIFDSHADVRVTTPAINLSPTC